MSTAVVTRLRFLPWEPLRAILVARGADSMTAQAQALGVDKRQVARWSAGSDIDWHVADRMVVRLNLHPFDVWGDQWLDLR